MRGLSRGEYVPFSRRTWESWNAEKRARRLCRLAALGSPTAEGHREAGPTDCLGGAPGPGIRERKGTSQAAQK